MPFRQHLGKQQLVVPLQLRAPREKSDILYTQDGYHVII